MDWFINNWQNVLFVFLLIIIGSYVLMTKKVNECLKAIVIQVEKELGSKTGEVKLHMAYDKFVLRFPLFSILVPFNVFASWVDHALDWMKEQLETNTKVYDYVEKND